LKRFPRFPLAPFPSQKPKKVEDHHHDDDHHDHDDDAISIDTNKGTIK
jgi:hypothetical protein